MAYFNFASRNPNVKSALNRMNDSINLLDLFTNAVSSVVNGIVGGSGAVAADANVEKAVQWAIAKANTHNVTYSQKARNLKIEGMSYDCSSFVITAFYMGGIDVDATYTGDMRAGFTAAGFTWIGGTYFDSSELRRGDILLKESAPGAHTQIYIGNNQDVNCGSTPARIMTHNANNYGRGWNGVLRLV